MSEEKNISQCSDELTGQVPAGATLSPVYPPKLSCYLASDASQIYPDIVVKARERWVEAKLRERRLVEEMEIETLRRQLEMKEKLLATRALADQAELEVRMAGSNDDIKLLEQADAGFSIDQKLEKNSSSDAKTLALIIQSLELPKVEIPCFEGDPADYWRFLRCFEANVASKTLDSATRLSFLIHYCRGEARKAVEGCVILPPDEGYLKAKSILESQFGQRHAIARAQIKKIVSGSGVKMNDGMALVSLAIDLRNCVVTLTQLDYLADLNCSNTIKGVLHRLPFSMQSQWAEQAFKIVQMGREPTMEDLTIFVENRAAVLNSEYGQLGVDRHIRQEFTSEVRRQPKVRVNYVQSPMQPTGVNSQPNTLTSCILCQGAHVLRGCDRFLNMDVNARQHIVRSRRLCNLCLWPNHFARTCRSGKPCSNCGGRHNVLLHKDSSCKSATEEEVTGTCGATSTEENGVFLGIVPVCLIGPNGVIQTCAFLDNGSDTTLIERGMAERLGLNGTRTSIQLSTLNGTSKHQSERVEVDLQSTCSNDKIHVDCAYTVNCLPKIGGRSPSHDDLRTWRHLRDVFLPMVDKHKVTILIGCNVPEAHWVLDQRRGDRQQPYAIKTMLGWMLLGPSAAQEYSAVRCNKLSVEDAKLKEQISRLFALEFDEGVEEGRRTSLVDEQAVSYVKNSLVMKDGHYEVGPPWKSDPCGLPNNKPLADGRAAHLRKRLLKDRDLFNKYKGIIDSYVEKMYVERVPEQEGKGGVSYIPSPKWYLPHHPVVNHRKSAKVRIVFDCAARFQGVCLNDILLQGPDLTNELLGVLLRFRKERIALVADIKEMFLQVRIPEKDRGAFRFLWWKDGNLDAELEEYQLRVHPFGATSSPFVANFALLQTVKDYGESYSPATSDAVREHFYVDDCLVSVDTVEAAVELVRQLQGLLRTSGFNLVRWVSNEKCVLKQIPVSDRATEYVDLDMQQFPAEMTLGVRWDVERDTFGFHIKMLVKPDTRRGILSSVASIYDPLGIIAPIVLPVKLLLQRLCQKSLAWDEPLPEETVKTWRAWLGNAHLIESISLQRCWSPEAYVVKTTELHLFCDASEVGYGAVGYLRTTSTDGRIHCSFIVGKSKVAPVRQVTIPRLELMAAVLSTRIAVTLRRQMRVPIEAEYFWTDSMIVLQYIRNTTSRFQTFVANRVATIHRNSEVSQWHHVRSASNPADVASRGIDADDMAGMKVWLTGPQFIWEPMANWPACEELQEFDTSKLELKRECHAASIERASSALTCLLARYSDWFRLQKAIAWLRRFVHYCVIMFGHRTDISLQVGPLQCRELSLATLNVVRLVQSAEFAGEMAVLRENRRQTRRGRTSLWNLNPFLDNGLLRVGGRLRKANVSREAKYPLIIPKRHHVTELIINHYHKMEGHTGVSQVLAAVRQRFWIVHGHAAVRRVISRCWTCKQVSIVSGKQLMAALPISRVTSGESPFISVGVDYFGPIVIKHSRKIEKRYGCIFTCLRIRAVHIEVAHSMSSDSFMSAFLRFVARRGPPRELYSDNGSNFKGAEADIRNALVKWDQTTLNNKMLEHGVDWHFNPPDCSHRGGVWERQIRSVRRILTSIAGEQTLDDETLVTLMAEVEKILNDRPITPVSEDPKDLEALTPSKLLLLRDNSCCDITINTMSERYARRWNQVQYLAHVFWKRWTREYLSTLQIRSKWITRERNLASGDLVLVLGEQRRRGRWPKGLVIKTYPDEQGYVRQVDVRTAGGVIRRDIRNLCLLEGSK